MRRAPERDIEFGASGGNMDWNVFIRRGRCGGVFGEGGGKDASTSYKVKGIKEIHNQRCEEML